MSSRLGRSSAVWAGGVLTCVVCALALSCSGSPQAGTESGNPINPPLPPGPVVGAKPDVDPHPEPSVQPILPSTTPPVPSAEPTETSEPPLPPSPDTSVEPPLNMPPTSEPSGEGTSPPISATGSDNPSIPPGVTSPGVMPTEPPPDPSPGDSNAPVPGTAGGETSCDEAECDARAQQAAAGWGEPIAAPPAFDGAACLDTDAGAALCECTGPAGVEVIEPGAGGCAVYGRLGHCLYEHAEAEACEGAEGCEATCEQVHARLLQDAERRYALTVTSSGCEPQCSFVVSDGQVCLEGPEQAIQLCPADEPDQE